MKTSAVFLADNAIQRTTISKGERQFRKCETSNVGIFVILHFIGLVSQQGYIPFLGVCIKTYIVVKDIRLKQKYKNM